MDIKTYKGKHTGKEIDEAVNNAPQLKTDVDHLNETMGAYSERESITLVPTATGYVINSNGVKTVKSGWAMAEFTAEKGNVYLFKPGATDGNVCVFAEAITSVETRGIDYTYTYNDDGTIATAVATYGGKTHSYTYTWVDGKATIKEGSTVVSELPMTYTTTVGSYSPLVRLNADAELPMDGYCRYMSHFKGNSAIKVVVSYKVDAADLTMKVTRDGVLASISTQLGNLSQKEDETRAQIAKNTIPDIWVNICSAKDATIKVDGQKITLPAHKTVTISNFKDISGIDLGSKNAPYLKRFNIKYNPLSVPVKVKHFNLFSYLWPDNITAATEFDVSGWDTSEMTSMYQMFYCVGAQYLDVSSFDTSNVTNMAQLFSYCTKVQTLDVANWYTSSVTNMQSMFSSCSSLATLDVANWDTKSVTNMSGMFYYCKSLTSLDVSNWVTSSVTNMRNLFSSCSKLTSLDVSKWDTSSVTDMNGVFYGCSSLTSLDVSNWVTSSVTNMSGMFYYCKSLTSLDVSNWDTKSVTNMSGTFSGCSSLTSLYVSNWDTKSVTDMGGMFYYCSSLTSLDVSNWDTKNVTTMSCMFYYCSSLTSLDVSNWDTKNVTTMSYMFQQCNNLETVDAGGWDVGNVTTLAGLFRLCPKLKSVGDLGKWNTSKCTSMRELFQSCQITDFNLTSFDTSSVTDISNMFQGNTAVASLDLSSFDTTKIEQMQGIFSGTQNLTNVILGEGWGKQTSTAANALTLDMTTVGASKSYKLTDATYNSMLTMYDRVTAGLSNMNICLKTKHNIPDGWADKMAARGYTIALV